MYIYTHTHIHIYIYMYIFLLVCLHCKCIYRITHTHTHTQTHTHTHTHIYIYIYIYIYTSIDKLIDSFHCIYRQREKAFDLVDKTRKSIDVEYVYNRIVIYLSLSSYIVQKYIQ